MMSYIFLVICALLLSFAHSAVKLQDYIKFHPATENNLTKCRMYFAPNLKCPILKSWNKINCLPVTREKFIALAKHKIRYHKKDVLKDYAPYAPSQRTYLITIKPYLQLLKDEKAISTTEAAIFDQVNTEFTDVLDTLENTFKDETTTKFAFEEFFTESVSLKSSAEPNIDLFVKDPDSLAPTMQATINHNTTEIISDNASTTLFEETTKDNTSFDRNPGSIALQSMNTEISSIEKFITEYFDTSELSTVPFQNSFESTTSGSNEHSEVTIAYSPSVYETTDVFSTQNESIIKFNEIETSLDRFQETFQYTKNKISDSKKEDFVTRFPSVMSAYETTETFSNEEFTLQKFSANYSNIERKPEVLTQTTTAISESTTENPVTDNSNILSDYMNSHFAAFEKTGTEYFGSFVTDLDHSQKNLEYTSSETSYSVTDDIVTTLLPEENVYEPGIGIFAIASNIPNTTEAISTSLTTYISTTEPIYSEAYLDNFRPYTSATEDPFTKTMQAETTNKIFSTEDPKITTMQTETDNKTNQIFSTENSTVTNVKTSIKSSESNNIGITPTTSISPETDIFKGMKIETKSTTSISTLSGASEAISYSSWFNEFPNPKPTTRPIAQIHINSPIEEVDDISVISDTETPSEEFFIICSPTIDTADFATTEHPNKTTTMYADVTESQFDLDTESTNDSILPTDLSIIPNTDADFNNDNTFPADFTSGSWNKIGITKDLKNNFVSATLSPDESKDSTVNCYPVDDTHLFDPTTIEPYVQGTTIVTEFTSTQPELAKQRTANDDDFIIVNSFSSSPLKTSETRGTTEDFKTDPQSSTINSNEDTKSESVTSSQFEIDTEINTDSIHTTDTSAVTQTHFNTMIPFSTKPLANGFRDALQTKIIAATTEHEIIIAEDLLKAPVKFTYDTDVMPTLDEY